MSYLILYGLFALWVLFDGLGRKTGGSAILWAVGTLFLGPIILPIYLASRPLKQGEVREGGKAWNVLKNFAILWTIVMAIVSISALMSVAKGTENLTSDAARAGAGIGMALGMGLLGALWFFPTTGAALLGFLMKKNSIIENGPTGPLFGQVSAANAVGGWAGLSGVAFVALILATVATVTKTGSSASTTNDASTGFTSTGSASLHAWEVTQKTNPMDGTKEAYLSLDASNEIAGFIGSQRPTLTIQCKKHRPEVVVNVGMPLQSEYGEYDTYKVRVKFDDSQPIAQRWTGATNNEAAFSQNPKQLVRQLSQSNTFLFEFTPFEKAETTVTFSVSGLKGKLQPVQDVCGLTI
jgi:hypothetical protein